VSEHPESCPTQRRIFCNRTLNLRSIAAIGYDMDYTLVHYNVREWEGRAYAHTKARLIAKGWPVEHLAFDHQLVSRGLVIDSELGNIVKANRFGYIKQALHGTHQLDFTTLRRSYARQLVDLGDSRYSFLNTLFSISEACMYCQLVDMFDDGALPDVRDYRDLANQVRHALDLAHVEGVLKEEIMADPQRFVEDDPDTALALLDQKRAGKKLVVITNSEWFYTDFMLNYAIERHLPEGMGWRDLFDLVVVSARKPAFFLNDQPIFEVVDDEGHLKPVVGTIEKGKAYLGGTASHVEKCLGLDGERILYVGDHIYGDVNVSKQISRWRTALILREMEHEIEAIEAHRDGQNEISRLMVMKEMMEHEMSATRLELQRKREGYGPQSDRDEETLEAELQRQRDELVAIDRKIGPLVGMDGRESNPTWGYLLRAGNDKSHLTRQLERYADIYTSRVSNFLYYTPFMYFRSPRGSLPHDPFELPETSNRR
jgi:HAD superfamily 5'-nucleotidase-like hydrolase